MIGLDQSPDRNGETTLIHGSSIKADDKLFANKYKGATYLTITNHN